MSSENSNYTHNTQHRCFISCTFQFLTMELAGFLIVYDFFKEIHSNKHYLYTAYWFYQ